MGDSLPPQNKHKHLNVFTFTLFLFIISFILILLIVLNSNRTLNLFVSQDLLSNTTITRPQPVPVHESTRPVSNKTHPILQQPVYGGPIDIEKNEDMGFVIGPGSDNGSVKDEVDEFARPVSNDTGPNVTVPINNIVPVEKIEYMGFVNGSVKDEVDEFARPVSNDTGPIVQQPVSSINNEPINTVPIEKNEDMGFVNGPGIDNGSVKDEVKKRVKSCNMYMGKWVKDDGYPVYEPGSCPYVDEAYDCQSNGRSDFEYMNWRWKPDDCDLPRFNATDFLARIRGKRLMLVGDSMNRNQFESMLCLLREGLPDENRMYEVHGYKITKGRGFYIFKFVDFNCTIEFVRSHFLVKEGTRINGQGNSNPTLSIDQIDKSAKKWKRADILVFNTGHWWTHGKTARGKNYFKEGDNIYPQFDAVEAYRRSLKTWGDWIDKNLNPNRQLVFYRAYSSAHFRGGDWDSGGSCNGETEPISVSTLRDSYPLKMKIVEDVIQNMKVPVILLNVTRLTNFRKDGHPSVFGKMRAKGEKVSTRKQDCSHWCLPGVPDAWNELIYATLVYQQTTINQL